MYFRNGIRCIWRIYGKAEDILNHGKNKAKTSANGILKHLVVGKKYSTDNIKKGKRIYE